MLLQNSRTCCDNLVGQTLTTFAMQAIGRKSCGKAAVANSIPAPNSIKRSPEKRSCSKFDVSQSIAWKKNQECRKAHNESKQIPASGHSQISSLGGQKASSQHAQPHPVVAKQYGYQKIVLITRGSG